MEGFSYVDIFATKHIEYLLVIVFLLLFVPFWRFLNRPAKRLLGAAEQILPLARELFRVPEGFYYHLGHSWALPEGGNLVSVGMDDFAQKLVGKIDKFELPEPGSTVTQGDTAWRLKVDSKVIEMLSPVDGRVVAINEEAIRSPGAVKEDPYGRWLIKVEAPRFSVNKRNLIHGAFAKRWMEDIKESLFARMNPNLGMVYQDGGTLVDGMAKHLDREGWDRVVKEFFLTAEA